MPRFAANLTMMYGEHDFLERYAAAARDGFTAIEFLFPYGYPAATLAARLDDHGLRQVLFNASPGDFARGDRGAACRPEQRDYFRSSVLQALDYAQALSCPRIHVMAGVAQPGEDRARLRDTYRNNLAWAAEQAAPLGVQILIEPINTRDMPGYFLNRQDDAHALVDEVAAGNLKVLMDLYHCQIVEGDVTMKLRQYIPSGRVAHLQIAGVPRRHEPDDGELNYPALFDELDALGYDGHVGCEYRPRAGTSQGLGWLRALT